MSNFPNTKLSIVEVHRGLKYQKVSLISELKLNSESRYDQFSFAPETALDLDNSEPHQGLEKTKKAKNSAKSIVPIIQNGCQLTSDITHYSDHARVFLQFSTNTVYLTAFSSAPISFIKMNGYKLSEVNCSNGDRNL